MKPTSKKNLKLLNVTENQNIAKINVEHRVTPYYCSIKSFEVEGALQIITIDYNILEQPLS